MIPVEQSFDAVDDRLIVLHLDGPVTVHRRVQEGESSRLIPPGGMFMMPGGMDFRVRSMALCTAYTSISAGVIEEDRPYC